MPEIPMPVLVPAAFRARRRFRKNTFRESPPPVEARQGYIHVLQAAIGSVAARDGGILGALSDRMGASGR